MNNRTVELVKLARKMTKIKLSNDPNKAALYKKTLFYELAGMGGIFYKGLQVMAVTQKFLDGWAGPAEMAVFNGIPTEQIDVDEYILDKTQFEFYEKMPFSSGSFAQVYRGKLKTGELVAIKILRPSIVKNLTADLKYLRRIVLLFGKFLPISVLDFNATMTEFCNTCKLETDYGREVANIKYFYNYYSDHPYVVIPKVYDRLCGDNVIVQDYIAGPTFADVLSQRENPSEAAYKLTGSNLWTQMLVAGGELVRQAMTADFVFGDPHPGNIKLLPDNKIAYIDFGIVAYRPTSRKAFYNWVVAYNDILNSRGGIENLLSATLDCFCTDFSIALKNCNLGKQNALEKLGLAMREKFDNSRRDALMQDLADNGHFFRLFTDVLDPKNALNVTLDSANFQLIKAMQSYLGSLTVLDHSENRRQFAAAMRGAMGYALTSVAERGVENDMPVATRYSESDGYELLCDLMSSLAGSDPTIFRYFNNGAYA